MFQIGDRRWLSADSGALVREVCYCPPREEGGRDIKKNVAKPQVGEAQARQGAAINKSGRS